jgi:RNA polymerase sigma-70 factor (ECF subfamily)
MDVEEIDRSGRARFGVLIDRAALAAFLDGKELAIEHAAEIYLGAACALRSAAALAALESAYIARVPDILAAKRLPAHAVDEIRQTVRERLLAGDPPYLANAVGKGTLAGLVAVVASRCALDWIRTQRPHESVGDGLAASADPAKDLDRARSQSVLKSAFEAAVEDLEARDRTLLRLHLVDGLTIDDVARMYQIHRATAARQIEKAREQVAASTRRRLALVEGLSKDDLGDLHGLVASQLDLSLSRVLATR